MMTVRWLAAVAGVALVAGAPVAAEAATRTKAHVTVKAKHRPARRVRVTRRRVAIVPVVASPLILPAPAPAYVAAPAADYAAYRWLDDAEAMLRTIEQSRPDRVFAVDRDARYAWSLSDGGVVIAEPLGEQAQRWYFFEPDVTAPFLVRDVARSYAFERGRLAAVYDRDGGLLEWRFGDEDDSLARDLADRGRQLWFAARAPAAAPPRVGFSWGQVLLGGDLGWRENGDWRAYRERNRREDRDDRYRREHEARMARGGAWRAAPTGAGGDWSGAQYGSRDGTRGGSREAARSGEAGRLPADWRRRGNDRPADTPVAGTPSRPGYAAPVEAVMPMVPSGSTEGLEQRGSAPAEPQRRRFRAVEAPAAEMPSAPAVERTPRYRPEAEAPAFRQAPVIAAPPAPAPEAPRAAFRPEPEAPARAREPEPARVAPPAPAPEPAPAPPPERPREQQREDEKPQ